MDVTLEGTFSGQRHDLSLVLDRDLFDFTYKNPGSGSENLRASLGRLRSGILSPLPKSNHVVDGRIKILLSYFWSLVTAQILRNAGLRLRADENFVVDVAVRESSYLIVLGANESVRRNFLRPENIWRMLEESTEAERKSRKALWARKWGET